MNPEKRKARAKQKENLNSVHREYRKLARSPDYVFAGIARALQAEFGTDFKLSAGARHTLKVNIKKYGPEDAKRMLLVGLRDKIAKKKETENATNKEGVQDNGPHEETVRVQEG